MEIYLKIIILAGMAYAGLSILMIQSARMFAKGLCVSSKAARTNSCVTLSEQQLAENYIRASKIVPNKYTGKLSRFMLARVCQIGERPDSTCRKSS